MYDMKQVLLNYKMLAGEIKRELDIQFDDGRIKGTEYADVFNKLMDRALNLAFETPAKDAQVIQIDAQTDLINAQERDQTYVTEQIRPIEQQAKQCEVDLCKAKTDLTQAQAQDQEYVTQHIRPIEMNLKSEQLALERTKNEIAQEELLIKKEELLLKKEELDIARQKLRLAEKDVLYKDAMIRFTDRQTEGFDDHKKQKMLDIQMNAWAMMFSSGLMYEVPQIINTCTVDGLYNMMAGEVGAPGGSGCAPLPTKAECEKKKAKMLEEYLKKAKEKNDSKKTE